MSEPEPIESRDKIQEISRPAAPHARAVGSPLSMGGNHQQQPSVSSEVNRLASVPVPGRALPGPVSTDDSSGMQRAVGIARSIIPIVQRLLPLLDGNIATAVGNLLSHRAQPQPAPAAVKVNLAPLQESLTALQTQHHSLHEQVMEQNSALKRVEDRLEMVREATDRNTLEQQELLEDLKAFSSRVKFIAVIGIGLLGLGLVLELLMFFHLQRVLP